MDTYTTLDARSVIGGQDVLLVTVVRCGRPIAIRVVTPTICQQTVGAHRKHFSGAPSAVVLGTKIFADFPRTAESTLPSSIAVTCMIALQTRRPFEQGLFALKAKVRLLPQTATRSNSSQLQAQRPTKICGNLESPFLLLVDFRYEECRISL